MIEIKKGNIFTTKCETIVNTINCIGIMGAGIAYEFRLRHPEMFTKYKDFCNKKLISIGNLWIFNVSEKNTYYKNILNFPTKDHWKYPSKLEYIEKGLEKFLNTYKQKNLTSVAFPLLGTSNGGLSEKVVIEIMQKYLKNCDILIEIWHFDSKAQDDLYDDFKNKFLQMDNQTIKKQSGLRENFINKIKEALLSDDIHSLSGLLKIKGIGDVTLEKSFYFIRNYEKNNTNLFTI